MGRTIAGAFAVVVEGARLLWGHWPVLVVLFLLGAAGREAALWAAFETSKFSPLLSALVVCLAPLATLTALILMLRQVMPSLHFTRGESLESSTGGRLRIVASALIPFLAVYAAQGYLKEDTRRYLNEVTADEYNNRTNIVLGEAAGARTIADLDMWVVAATVVIALVLRWALDRFRLPERNVGLGLLAAWVESIWLVFAAKNISNLFGIWDWIRSRVYVEWLLDAWGTVVALLGPVGGALDRAVSWLWGVLGDFDTLVVIPLAWLTIGAVVYGKELADPAPAPGLPVTDERLQRRLARAEELRARMRQRARVDRVPPWLRSWVLGPVTAVRDRFAGLGKGLLTLLRAGLIPMVTLCLVFLLARQAELGVGHLLRRLVGPMEPDFAVAASTYFGYLMDGAGFVLMAVLVAAAVDRFLVQAGREVQAESEARAAVTDPA